MSERKVPKAVLIPCLGQRQPAGCPYHSVLTRVMSVLIRKVSVAQNHVLLQKQDRNIERIPKGKHSFFLFSQTVMDRTVSPDDRGSRPVV